MVLNTMLLRPLLLVLLVLSHALLASAGPTTGTSLQLWTCNASSPFQSWLPILQPFPRHNIHLGGATPSLPYTGLNLNTLGFSNSTGGILNVWTDSPENPYGQNWGYSSDTIVSGINGLCAGTSNSSGVLPAGTPVVQVDCAANGLAATWTYHASTGLFSWGLDPTLCLDAGTSFSCFEGGANETFPYCNPALTPQARTQDLINRMLPTEKAAFLSVNNNGVQRLGVPPLRYGEALHGVLSGCGKAAPPTSTGFVSTGCPTSFPTGLGLGSAFNRTLWKAVGDTIGQEARALFNQGVAQLMLFTPDLNGYRDPRWGRGMEVPSEDAFHSGEYAANYISGLQAGDSGIFMRAVAMPKHGFVYDQEGNFGVHDRTNFCAPLSLKSFMEYHLPPFKAALQRGKAGGMMCSANGYGVEGLAGQASCAHAEINEGLLRQQWGWEGAVVTDGNGVGYLWESYGTPKALNCGDSGAHGPTGAVRVGLKGGVDVEDGETLNNYALAAIADGNITTADMDKAIGRTIPFLFKLGLMDPPASVPWAGLGAGDVDTEAARALALEAATQAVVLLRNEGGVIPLSLPGLTRVALIGPSVDDPSIQLANYHGENRVAQDHTPLAAFQATIAGGAGGGGSPPFNTTLVSAMGCDNVLCETTAGFPQALSAAGSADVIVYIGGGAPWRGGAGAFNSTEGEELDRADIGLPGHQEDLILALLGTGKPVVLVLMRGGPIGLSPTLFNDPRLATIIHVCYPGEMGGDGLVRVLTGAVAPSGRLSTTLYPPDFVGSRAITDYNMSSGEGVTHMFYTGVPQFVYGAGLSTTTWELQWWGGVGGGVSTLLGGGYPTTSDPLYAINITNTGGRTSDISILAFLTPPATPGEPLQKLFDFNRAAAVAPGETVTLFFSVPQEVAATVGSDGEFALHHGTTLGVSIGIPGGRMLNGSLQVVTKEGKGKYVVSPKPF